MPVRRVVVVAETESLASSLSDLLRSAGIRTTRVTALEALETLGSRAGPTRPFLMVVASAGPTSATARRWLQGEFPGAGLIVVGSRDPVLAGGVPRLDKVDLPLRATELLELVRQRIPDGAE